MKNIDQVVDALKTLYDNAENDFEKHRIITLIKDLIKPPEPEIIDDKHCKFNGLLYRKDNFGHYRAHSALHRAIFEYYKGDIPEGLQVHHKDFNPENNDISNLQLVTHSEHKKIHTNKKTEFICSVCGKKYFAYDNKRNSYCSQRCRSKAMRERLPVLVKKCVYCGKEFQTVEKNSKFCSSACGTKFRYDSKTLVKTCPTCGKIFETTDHKNKKFCSHSCSQKAEMQKRKKSPQEKQCLMCGKKFVTAFAKKIYCSGACKQKAVRERSEYLSKLDEHQK